MKITLNRNELLSALEACKFNPKNRPLCSQSVRLTFGDTLRIQASDLQEYIAITVECMKLYSENSEGEINQDEISVDTHRGYLVALIATLRDTGVYANEDADVDAICFDVQSQTDAYIYATGDETNRERIYVLEYNRVPEFPSLELDLCASINPKNLLRAYNNVKYCCDKNSASVFASNILIHSKLDEVRLVATDGKIMANSECHDARSKELRVVVAKRHMKRVIEYVKSHDTDSSCLIYIDEKSEFAVFVYGDIHFTIRLQTSMFPLYETIEPRAHTDRKITATVVSDVLGMLSIVDNALTHDSGIWNRLHISKYQNGLAEIHTDDRDSGGPSFYAGRFVDGEICLSLNGKYLQKILCSFKHKYARFDFYTPTSPFSITPCDEEGNALGDLYVTMMPMMPDSGPIRI